MRMYRDELNKKKRNSNGVKSSKKKKITKEKRNDL